MKSVEVQLLCQFIGSRETNFASISTAAPVNSVKAETIPIRTRSGEDCAANVMVMVWVLSPNSAMSMSANAERIGIHP